MTVLSSAGAADAWYDRGDLATDCAMRDQFEKLTNLGLTAAQVNSALPADEVRRTGRRSVPIRRFLSTTPEQLASSPACARC